MEFTRINNDINGNPRYVVHFLELITERDEADLKAQMHPHTPDLEAKYKLAVKRANKIGGRKYHTKSYGGGIVFQSYNTGELRKQIEELRNNG